MIALSESIPVSPITDKRLNSLTVLRGAYGKISTVELFTGMEYGTI